MNNKKFALIVAGGNGQRMMSALPKQFLRINGKPLLMYAFEAFTRFDRACEFILVLPDSEIDHWRKLCEDLSFDTQHKVVAGGTTRFYSVKNGLAHINEDGIVFIHDGVRPLVSQQTIENCYRTACEKGNALPVIVPSESIREVFDEKSKAVNRERFFLVQTPQTFQISLIKKAYNKEYHEKYTDDASVLESDSVKINLVQGNRENIKITYPEDIKIAAALLAK
jgi:2-C-methyl-D-erythritol 4-phosphate cytidylyltransferase